ncbi:MAG: PASTA domain-containing protein [Methanomassiliicoccaceae archaeon]|nr:PASTA domain-containing protein [Methanomassiliicoccaceae archaeon]
MAPESKKEVTPVPKESEDVDPKTAVGEFYSDIADILNNLGQGLANAQKKLDIGAMMSQKEILEDDVLSGYGLSANWYVMPEAEFNMMMELGVTEREEVEGELADGRLESSNTKIVAALSDAKYSALYNSELRQESSLRVRFVPVPMPSVVMIPDLVGLPVAAALSTVSEARVGSRFINEDGESLTDEKGVVISQSISGGHVMLADRTLVVTVRAGGKRKRPSTETEPLTLGEAFRKLREAAEKEVSLWTGTWPPEEVSREAIVGARIITGKAARRYVKVADLIGAVVCKNAKVLSKTVNRAKAEQAVEEIFISITEDGLTEEQLKYMLVFDAPVEGTD